MKKNILTFILMLFVSINLSSQINKDSKEKIKALKAAFLTQELNLSAETAQKFWPIYNKHETKLDALRDKGRSEVRMKLKKTGSFDALTEQEAKSFVNSKLEIDKKILAEKESFLKQISKVLTYKKILKLHISEREFTRKLMRKYRERKQRKK
ncbi:MAG: sensor of ECF-type sigma factor [Polaribacter sp.]